MARRLASAICLAALLAASAPGPVLAHPDAAQVESATRPDFGWLLQPPTWPGGPGPYGPGWRGYGGGFPPPYPGYGGGYWRHDVDRVVVDCTGWHAHMVERALASLRPGGTLILRTHGRACTEPLYISRSVQIVGEEGFNYFGGGGFQRVAFTQARAVLNAPPGQPCIAVAPGVHAVSIRGLVINAPDGQGASCIEARDAEVEIADTVIRYEGSGSAVNIEGGTARLKNLGVAARTPAPAVVTEGADVSFEDLRIAAVQLGLLVEPGPGESHLVRVFARALDGAPNDSPGDDAHPTTGLMVRGGSTNGNVEITDAVMLGFSTGARFDHDVKAELRYGRIGFSKVGVLTDGDVGVKGVTIGASEVGVYARSGHASVIHDRVYGVHYAALYADVGAKIWAEENYIYPGPDCGFMGDQAYNATGQTCRPWDELPAYFREEQPYAGRFEDGWSEWNYDWGYDWRSDGWREGPGYYDEAAWRGRAPVWRDDYGYRGLGGYPRSGVPAYTRPIVGERPAPQSPSDSTDPYRR